MLNLENKITINEKTIGSGNLCDYFTDDDLARIGVWVSNNYTRDKESRADWTRRSEAAMNLAMQIQHDKSFPWPGCANIAFPLVTIAAMQFHARAYPAIVNGRKVVATRVIGPDPEGLARRRAELISEHMSWQLLEEDTCWEAGLDQALLNVSIVGGGWKKTYYNSSLGHSVSEFVQSKDFVINYWAKSVESCPAKTHIIPMYRNDIYERVRRGAFRDVLEEEWFLGPAQQTTTFASTESDNRAGITPPAASDSETPFNVLEQHCSLDLDCDGYAEPYIITFEETTSTVLRIALRFNRIEDVEYNSQKQIVKINADEYFTKIPFIPSPDGSIMDVGFGMLLGPLNESVNAAINQLFDAGTLSNTAGGFLGRGAKIRGGVYQFQPFGWNRVDSTGEDLRKSIFPLPVREPSAVMFNLLSLIIDYTNRISGSTDMMVGENPGQNTPAETSRAMLEQGQKIYSAIFKRVWRSMKDEFKKLYQLNAVYLPLRTTFGEGSTIGREVYSAGGTSVYPVADPTISSDGAKFAKARLLREAAATGAGYDTDEVEREYLRGMGYDDLDKIFPGTKGQEPPVDIKIQIQSMKSQVEMAKLEQAKMEFVVTMQENVRLNTAKIAQLTATANKLEIEAQSEPAKQNVAAFRAGIEALREQNKQNNAQLDRMMEQINAAREANTGTGTIPGMAAPSGNGAVDAMGIPQEGLPSQ